MDTFKVPMVVDLDEWSDEQVFEVVSAALNNLRARIMRHSIYEPTGRDDLDSAHYQRLKKLGDMEKVLKTVLLRPLHFNHSNLTC